jgi:hypothetical protein
MNITWGRVAAIAAAAGTMAVAGCGGDDGGDDTAAATKEMQAALVKSVTVNDVQVECVETVTKHFVTTIYKTEAACRKAEAKPEENPATGATLSDVKLDGDRATATATIKGGDEDGATGELQFAKEDGDWKVDGLSAAFLRSSLTKTLSKPGDGALADAGTRTCIRDGLLALQDAEFTALAYDAISDRDNQTFLKIATGCISDASSSSSSSDDTSSSGDTGEPSGLRKKFEEGIAESAKEDGKTDKEIDCIVKKLRRSITDDDIVAQIGKTQKDLDPKVTKATANAIIDCS